MKRFVGLLLLGSVVGLATPGYSATTTINYSDFSNVAGLQLNGDASSVGNRLRLTPAGLDKSGNAFLTVPIALGNNASFSTAFQFQITGTGGLGDTDGPGADGLVFVVQTVSNNVGGSGGFIGYGGIPKSLGVEFDTYNNGAGDQNNGNHIGINVNGSVDSLALTPITPRFNDGNVWYVWVDYNGSNNLLEARVAPTNVRPVASTVSLTRNLSLDLGSNNAFVGFTSGTGGGFGNHEILSWTFVNDFVPINTTSTSEPISLLLVGIGLLPIVYKRCRNKDC